MSNSTILTILLILFASFVIFGYFTIRRLMERTGDKVFSYQKSFRIMVSVLTQGKKEISGWNKRFLDLENEIRLQKSDSSRLIEWLDKERMTRGLERDEFLRALKITERESRIIEISERLKLIATRK